MTRTNPNWLTCQINGISDYIRQCPASLYVLRALAEEFRKAAQRVDAEIDRRTSAGRADDGVFG